MSLNSRHQQAYCSYSTRVWRETAGLCWQGKTEVGEKRVPVPLCPPQIPHRLSRARTRAPVVRGRQLTAWAIARPYSSLTPTFSKLKTTANPFRDLGLIGVPSRRIVSESVKSYPVEPLCD
jgi:hypothetical protein